MLAVITNMLVVITNMLAVITNMLSLVQHQSLSVQQAAYGPCLCIVHASTSAGRQLCSCGGASVAVWACGLYLRPNVFSGHGLWRLYANLPHWT